MLWAPCRQSVTLRHVSSTGSPWFLRYRREWLGADVLAGLTGAAVIIPKAMAYAVIAGLSVEIGLYTALAAMLVYPLLGSSRALSVTTTSAIAMLTAAEVAHVSTAGGAGAAAIAPTLALLVGAALIGARALRLGFLGNFISLPVLIGFEAGVGLVIVIGQLPAALGLHLSSKTTIDTLLELPGALGGVHAPTALVSLVGIVFLVVLPRLFPRVSAPLVWVALSIVASAALGLEALGVASVGRVPSGLPSLVLPDLGPIGALWPAALGIGLMSFTESVAAARTFQRRGDPPINPDRELLAIGVANAASALVGGLAAGGGASQTAVVDGSGARSQLAQWVAGGVVLLTLLFLSDMIALLPKAALAALIVLASVSMIKPQAFRAIARVRSVELTWALVTLVGVIAIGTLEGILIAVAISILTLIYQSSRPAVYALAYNRKERLWRRAGECADDETFDGMLLLRAEGRMMFANAAIVGERMQALVAETEPRVIVLDCSAIPDIEYTALCALTDAEHNLRARGVSLWLAKINPGLLPLIERSPLGAALGKERVFDSMHHMLEAWESAERGAGRAARKAASAG